MRPNRRSARRLGLLGLLLARLGDARVPEMRVADARIFLDIADASFLATSRTARKAPIAQGFLGQQLATALGLSFTMLAEEQWTGRAIDWLSRAAEDEHSRDPLLSVLASGARSSTFRLSALYVLANRAQYRDAITQVVLAKISAAQGVELPRSQPERPAARCLMPVRTSSRRNAVLAGFSPAACSLPASPSPPGCRP